MTLKNEIEYFWQDCRRDRSKNEKAEITKFKNFLAKNTDVDSLAKLIAIYWFQGFDEGVEVISRKVVEGLNEDKS